MPPSIGSRISDTAGLPYEKLAELKGVLQLDILDKDNAVVITQQGNGALNLETVPPAVIDPRPKACLAVLALILFGSGQAPTAPTIRWEDDPSGVSVVGLSPGLLKAFKAGDGPTVLAIMVESKTAQADRPSMLGSYRVEGDSLRFTPRYPFDRGRTYSATFRPSRLTGGKEPDLASSHLVPKPARPATVVSRVSPATDRPPENLLKFYLSFSSPMSRGEVYDRVRLLKADGKAVDFPFLRLNEELWDPTGTRLTVLIDPGRIKRGLKPREEFGPVLEAGREYTLVIDAAWPDAEGDPLGSEFRKTFRAGPADEVQPNPDRWTIDRPSASTRNPLTVTFPEPLDRALIASALGLVDPDGRDVAGKFAVEDDETRWRFTPENPWIEGEYGLEVDTDLEDLAGNSIRRPFEVDVVGVTTTRPESSTVRRPIAIRPKGR